MTNANLNTHVRDNLRYLKGNDGTTTLEDSLAMSGTAHMFIANVVTSANRPAGTVGGMVYQTASADFQFYEGASWFDRRDLTVMTATSMGTGDIFYASGPTAIARLAAGASGSLLRANGAAAPSWAASTSQITVIGTGSGTYTLAASGTVAAVSIASGLLGTTDRILVLTRLISQAGSNVGSVSLAQASSDLGRIGPSGSLTGGTAYLSETYISKGTGAADFYSMTQWAVAGVQGGGSAVLTGSANFWTVNNVGLATNWTGTWQLALQAGSQTAGTLVWDWIVYQMKSA